MSREIENPVSDLLVDKMEVDEYGDFKFEKDSSPDIITDTVGRVVKERRYVSDPSDAPEDAEVEEGPQGGYYYETGDGANAGGESGSDSPTVNVDSEEDLQQVFETGWDETTDDRGVLDEAGLSYEEFADRVETMEQEMGGVADTITAAGMVIEDLKDETDVEDESGEVAEPEVTSEEGRTLWQDELETNYGNGDQITVDTEQAGELTGHIEDEEFIEFGELVLVEEDGTENIIPIDDIEGLEQA